MARRSPRSSCLAGLGSGRPKRLNFCGDRIYFSGPVISLLPGKVETSRLLSRLAVSAHCWLRFPIPGPRTILFGYLSLVILLLSSATLSPPGPSAFVADTAAVLSVDQYSRLLVPRSDRFFCHRRRRPPEKKDRDWLTLSLCSSLTDSQGAGRDRPGQRGSNLRESLRGTVGPASFDLAFRQKLNISPAASVDFHDFRGKIVLVLLITLFLTALLRRRRWTVMEVALLLFALYSGLAYLRFLFPLAIVAAPVLAKMLDSVSACAIVQKRIRR